MNVNGINSGAVNWETLLNRLGDVQKTTGADGRETLTVTVKVGEGQTTYTFGVPDDLELPATVDQAAIDTLCAKLLAEKDAFNLTDEQIAMFKENLSEALASVKGSVKTESKNVMFDLYKLMALLVEVAQKQRDAAREMRQAENVQVQLSIQNQADAQRTAALTGLIAGAICCTIQMVATGVALGKQAKAYAKQTAITGESGLASAKQNLSMLKTANSPEAAAKQLATVKAEVGGKPSGVEGKTVEQAVNDGFQGSRDAKARLDAAKGKLQNDTEMLQLFEQLKSSPDTLKAADFAQFSNEEAGQIKTALNKLEVAQQKLEIAQKFEAGGFKSLSTKEKAVYMNMQLEGKADVAACTAEVNACKAEVGAALEAKVNEVKATIEADKTAIENARQEYRAAINADINRFENEYEIAHHEESQITKDTPKAEADAAKAKLAAAEQKLKLARAEGFNKFAEQGITTENEYFQSVKDAQDKATTVDNLRQNAIEYKDAQRTIDRTNTALSVINIVGNSANSMINSITQWQQSSATRKGAEQKKSEEELDQTKDLFNQAQTLVDSVIKLMQAVTQAETQSMRDAIQA